MLNAPNGMPERCDGSLGVAKMPDGYELWRDEDGYYWWMHTATSTEGAFCWDKWAVYRGAKLHSKVGARHPVK